MWYKKSQNMLNVEVPLCYEQNLYVIKLKLIWFCYFSEKGRLNYRTIFSLRKDD